jgi:FkbM family methyltransferase
MSSTATIPGPLPELLRWYVRYMPTNLGKPAAAEKLVAHFRASPETKLARTWSGRKFYASTDDLLQGYLYLFGIWEPNLTHWLCRTIRPGDTFVDVGANVGYYSALASHLVGEDGHVVAVEPAPDFAEAIRTNLELNGCRNVRLVNAAASDGPRELDFYQPNRFNRGNTTSVLAEVNPQLRPLFSAKSNALTELLTADELRQARLVKIDVEGAEYDVVQGLLSALPSMHPDVELVLEINPELLAGQGHTAAELVDLLNTHGFHAYRMPNGYCISDYLPRQPPASPQRWRSPITELSDYVFSRIDTKRL